MCHEYEIRQYPGFVWNGRHWTSNHDGDTPVSGHRYASYEEAANVVYELSRDEPDDGYDIYIKTYETEES